MIAARRASLHLCARDETKQAGPTGPPQIVPGSEASPLSSRCPCRSSEPGRRSGGEKVDRRRSPALSCEVRDSNQSVPLFHDLDHDVARDAADAGELAMTTNAE